MTDRELAEFDIPVTEDFVRRVRRGVRRRRLLRAAATGGAALAVAGVVAGGFAVARGGSEQTPAPPVAASPAHTGATLDGFVLGTLPPGVTKAGADSFYTARVTEQGLVNDGAAPGPGDPSASVTLRRYERAGGAVFFVTVLRPATGDAAAVGARLLTGATAGATPAATFDTPAGTVRLFTSAGTETTTHRAVVATADHVVITVEGNGSVRAGEVEELARGIGR